MISFGNVECITIEKHFLLFDSAPEAQKQHLKLVNVGEFTIDFHLGKCFQTFLPRLEKETASGDIVLRGNSHKRQRASTAQALIRTETTEVI